METLRGFLFLRGFVVEGVMGVDVVKINWCVLDGF